ncbi:TPA: hypothetical protein ACJFWM_000497 [Salmonella enterica subsp. enterica serovar Aberdeen]
MTTITNKKQYPSEQYLNELITNMEFAAMAPVEVVRVMAAELQERRKADNQEPAGYHVIRECGKVGCSVATLEEAEKTRDFWNKKWTIRPYFYSAAPVPVVPDEWTIQDAVKFCKETGRQDAGSAMEAWNACRNAMLNGGKS